jgi:hypothetical protein
MATHWRPRAVSEHTPTAIWKPWSHWLPLWSSPLVTEHGVSSTLGVARWAQAEQKVCNWPMENSGMPIKIGQGAHPHLFSRHCGKTPWYGISWLGFEPHFCFPQCEWPWAFHLASISSLVNVIDRHFSPLTSCHLHGTEPWFTQVMRCLPWKCITLDLSQSLA